MPNTTITQHGLDYASSASPVGTLIAPVYWVPVYDPRIDGLIHDNVIPVSAFSACVNVSATAPTGEIIWNVNPNSNIYSLSDINTSFIISAANSENHSTFIANPVQSQKWQINQLDDVPLSPHFSATNAYFDPSNKEWDTSATFSNVPGNGNISPESGRAKYFPVIDYYPVSANAGDSKLRGMIKCRFAKDIGTIKYNKIALYITKYNSSGVESPDEPVFFAECQLKTTVVKTNMATNGFDDVTVDVQLDLHSISANWNDVFYSTSGDYWSRVPGGLYYPERVGIGSFIDSILEPQASLHVRRTRAMVDLGITDAPVARFDFDDSNYHEKDIDNTGVVHDTYNSAGSTFGIKYSPDLRSFYPDVDGTVAIGQQYDRFNGLYLNESGLNISVKYYSGESPYFKIHYEPYGMGGFIETTDDTIMDFAVLSGGADPSIDKRAYIKGADICRENESLFKYTIKSDAHEPDLYIMAGVDASFSGWDLTGITNQNGITHKNISHYLSNSVNLTNVEWLSTTSQVQIYGRRQIGLNGPVVLEGALSSDGNVLDIASEITHRKQMLMVAGLRTDILFSLSPALITQLAYVIRTTDDTAAQWAGLMTALTPDAEFEMLGNIRHSSDIIPLISSTYSSAVGSTLGRAYTYNEDVFTTVSRLSYKRLFVDTIGAYHHEFFKYDGGNWYYTDNRVTNIYAVNLGTPASTYSRISKIAVGDIINHWCIDIGTISTTNDSLYPGTYSNFNGLWPKRYINFGNLTDMRNTVGYGTTNQSLYSDNSSPSSGRTILNIYSQNYSVTNQITFEEAFTVKGYYKGANPAITKHLGSDADTDWPGIHPLPGILTTLGDSDNPIYMGRFNTIYADTIQNNAAIYGVYLNMVTADIITSLNVPLITGVTTFNAATITASVLSASTSIRGKYLGKKASNVSITNTTYLGKNIYYTSIPDGNFVDVLTDGSHTQISHVLSADWTAGSFLIIRNPHASNDLSILFTYDSDRIAYPGYARFVGGGNVYSGVNYITLGHYVVENGVNLYRHALFIFDGTNFILIKTGDTGLFY